MRGSEIKITSPPFVCLFFVFVCPPLPRLGVSGCRFLITMANRSKWLPPHPIWGYDEKEGTEHLYLKRKKKTVKSMYEKMGLKHTDEWIIMLLVFSLDLVSYFIFKLDFFFFLTGRVGPGCSRLPGWAVICCFFLRHRGDGGNPPPWLYSNTFSKTFTSFSFSLSPVTNRRGWREQQGKSQSPHLNKKISTCPSP